MVSRPGFAGVSRERELFDACLALDPPERDACLEQACGGDAALRDRVQRLLAAHERAQENTLRPLQDLLGRTLRATRGVRSPWSRSATALLRHENRSGAAMLRLPAMALLGVVATLGGSAALWQARVARAERARGHAIAELASTVLRESALEPWQAATASAERSALQVVAEADRHLGRDHPLAVDARLHLRELQARLALDGWRHAEAERIAREAVALAVARRGHRDETTIALRIVHGRARAQAGDVQGAMADLDGVLQDASDAFGPASRKAGLAAGELATWQREAGEIKLALQTSDRAIAILASHDGGESQAVAIQLATRGATWLAARRGAEALRDLTAISTTSHRALPLQRAVALAYEGRLAEADAILAANPVRSSDRRHAAGAWHAVGVVKRLAGEPAAALRAQREALVSVGDEPLADWMRMRVLGELGRAQVDMGRYAVAEASLRRAVALFEGLELRRSPAQAEAQMALGRALLAGGQPAEGLALLERADRFWLDFDPENRGAGEAALWLGLGYRSLGRSANAARAQERADRLVRRPPEQ